MSEKRKACDALNDQTIPPPGKLLTGAQKLLARKKARGARNAEADASITRHVGQRPSKELSMARLVAPPLTPSPLKGSLVAGRAGRPPLGDIGARKVSDLMGGAPFSPYSSLFSPTLSFKTGLSPSLTPGFSSTRTGEVDDGDSLPEPPRPLAPPSGNPATATTGTANEIEDDDDDEDLSWWQLAGRAMDTVFTNVGWFLGYREQYLLESVRLDGPPLSEKCTECLYVKNVPYNEAPAAEYRCEDCRGGEWCRACAKDVHRYAPLHRIEHWVGQFWYRVRRKASLGIEMQLMHPVGERCPLYDFKTVDNFLVVHDNGIHEMRVLFCRCSRGRDVDDWAQLMRSKLWPSTTERPQSATTFEALDGFTRLSLLGRLSGYDYHKAVEAATDGARILGLSSLRKQFMRCARQFGHIFLFKRAGRAHEDGGIAGTPPGECAVRCPACPREGYNIPSDWRSRRFPWSYRVQLSTDANFRMSNRLTRSNDSTDPCFNDGRAYMVPMKDFNAYVNAVDAGKDDNEVEEKAECSRFKAQGQVDTKGHKGLRTTGVAGVFCARHEFWQPLGLAPLKKGERYSVIDYISCMVHGFLRAPEVVHSYDIACQWHRNLDKRLKAIKSDTPSSGLFAGARAMLERVKLFVVPKMHVYAHIRRCFARYNFNFTRGVGQTDGEACERVWAGANPAANSLREMGPGSMRDTLDNMCSSWNHQKACGLALLLRDRMENALVESRTHAGILTAFTTVLYEREPRKLAESMLDVEKFEGEPDPRKRRHSPYEDEVDEVASNEIEARAIRTDAAKHTGDCVGEACNDPACAAASGDDADEIGKFLLRGLKIEDLRAKGKAGVVDEPDELDTGSTKGLSRAVLAFKEEQQRLMPTLSLFLKGEDVLPNEDEADLAKLHLPSQLPDHVRKDYPALVRMEESMRFTRLGVSLDKLRTLLQLRTYVNKTKIASSRSQGAMTRARTAQEAVDKRVQVAADTYRRDREAYLALVGRGDWELRYHVLQPEDVRGLGDRVIEQIENLSRDKAARFVEANNPGAARAQGIKVTSGLTKFRVSWIWYNASSGDEMEISKELMMEWCKARARAQRWVEEVITLWREMSSFVQSCDREATTWDIRAARANGPLSFDSIPSPNEDVRAALSRYNNDTAVAAGLRAYALKQSYIRRARGRKAKALFEPFTTDVNLFLQTHSEDGWQWDLVDGPPVFA